MSENIEQLLPDVFARVTKVLMDHKSGRRMHSNVTHKKAREVLGDKEATATAVFLAVHHLLGNAFIAWEPESIWLELSDTEDIDLSLENRDKLMAAMTLLHGDAFHWDALIFENTVEAFNNIPSAPDAIQEASPGEIAWGAYEAELLAQYAGYVGEYDYEPARYTALSMYRDGLAVAPELLTFAQEELDKLTDHSDNLKSKTIERWNEIDKTKLESLELEESPEDVQVGRLAAIHLYLGKRAKQLAEEVEAL